MDIITETEYRKRLKNGVRGVFVFFGAEDYLKAYAVKATREAVCPDEGFACFNDITIDFPDFTVDGLARALEAPPMMADCKIVVLKSFNFGAIKPTECDAVLRLIEEYGNDEMNVLIISVIPDGLDVGYLPKKPSALMKKIMENATPVQFEASTPAKLAVWAARHFEHEGIKADERTSRFLVDYCGSGMYELSNEIKKLSAYLHFHCRDRVTEEDIRFVSVPVTDFDPFAFSNAAMNGKRAEALEALAVMKFRQVKPEHALAEIAALYSNMYMAKLLKENGTPPKDISRIVGVHEFKVGLYLKATEHTSLDRLKRSVELCLDADLAMKTYAKRNYEQIEKLICLL